LPNFIAEDLKDHFRFAIKNLLKNPGM